MNVSRLLAASGAALALAASASAASFSTNFEPAGADTAVSLFANADLSFHNGFFGALQDEFGDDIPGSDQWQIDVASDTNYPLQVISTLDMGYGAAPSGSYALNVVDQSVLIVFNQLVDITGFSVTLDNSTYGNLFASNIDFVNGSTVLHTVGTDQTMPGLVVSIGETISGVRAIALPTAAYYDDLVINYTVSAIPEPSSFAALAGVGALGLAALRRRRARA